MSKLIEFLYWTSVIVLFAGFIGIVLGYYRPTTGVVAILSLYSALSSTAFALLEREKRKKEHSP